MRRPISEELRERILVLDGAMGTMIQSLSLGEEEFKGERFVAHPSPLKGLNDVLCLTRPGAILAIHRQYIEAGTDIIETNTFNSNHISLAEYGLDDLVEEINYTGALLAREAAGENHYVAGSMGPTGISLSIPTGHQVTFDQLADTYCLQASALIRGGVDLLLVETVFDTLNAKAAVYGIEQAFERTGRIVPIMISATLTESGRLLSGQSLEGFVTSVSLLSDHILSLGLNCGFGAREMAKFLPPLKESSKFVSVHPNAGLPDEMGRYTETPLSMVWKIRPMIEGGMVNIVGGCCGTTPQHIEAIATEVKGKLPRIPAPADPDSIELAGLERFNQNGFIKVGERCNVAGSRKFLRLIGERKFEEAKEIALSQLDRGASVIDINMDDAMLDSKRCMAEFVNLLTSDPATASVPIMIDSSYIDVIFNTLKLIQGRPLVNSISLKEGEERFVHNAREIKRLGGVVIVMAFDEQGQADTLDRRIEICGRAFKILTDKAGMRPGDIVFDPNVLTVGTGIKAHDNYALDFLNATQWIHKNLYGARVVGGISNLSFAFRGHNKLREAIHTVFLYHAIRMGLGLAIVNPATSLDIESVPAEWRDAIEDLLFNRREDSGMKLLELVGESEARENNEKESKQSGQTTVQGPGDARNSATGASTKGTPRDEESRQGRLSDLLMRGTTQGIEPAIEEELCLHGGSAMRVVNESLIATMNRIGELFGTGRMFLPQVVRSATVMKEAVRIMSPLIEKESNALTVSRTMKKIILATVKGDVHDIGKNIVGIVLRCSGYEVIDLGVMVPKEVIVDKAVETGADFIGLSGLISPSLREMGEVIALLEERGLRLPVFIGGAATSALHTAVKLAPGYSGPVIHTVDAAALPGIAKKFADSSTSADARRRNCEQQRRLREEYQERQNLVSLDEARHRAHRVASPMPTPKTTGTLTYQVKVGELIPLINWRAFLGEWKVDPSGETAEGVRLVEEAKEILEGQKEESGAIARCVITRARSTDRDEIIVEDSGVNVSIPLLRRQCPLVNSGECPSLSDYVAERGDSIGVFGVTVLLPDEEMPLRESEELGREASKESLQSQARGNSDSYGSILRQTINHRLAEAATEWLHLKVSTGIWGRPEKSGVRPAVGYPSLPDQSLMFVLDEIVRFNEIGITLTENGAMTPPSSTAGLILPSPHGKYFSVGPVDDEQLKDYEDKRQSSSSKQGYYRKDTHPSRGSGYGLNP